MLKKEKKNEKLCTKGQRLAFISRGSNRRELYSLLLRGQRTIAQISVLTSIHLSNVSRVIKDFVKNDLVTNVTPTDSLGCIYQLTPLGQEFQAEFKELIKFRVEK
ncbi:MAG: hypothetical protein ACXADY_10660 [Candidatus Hodarchaeales archaeon]